MTKRMGQISTGEFFRLVDGDGRSRGRRYSDLDMPELFHAGFGWGARVRIVRRQEEDLHSQLSRMMKRAHKAAMKD